MESHKSFSKTAFFVTSAVCAALAVISYWQQKRKNQPPTEWKPVGKVLELNLYPLKSGKKFPVKSAECTKFGPKQCLDDQEAYQMKDRELVVYKASDLKYITGRTHPKMVLVEVNVHDENYFTVDAPGMPTLCIKRPTAKETPEILVKCWAGEPIAARDCGDQAAAWFSKFILGEHTCGLRLAYQDGSNFKRDIEKAHKNDVRHYKHLNNDTTGIFSYMASFLVMNKSSVDDLASRIENANFTVDNFRPNIVVDCDAYSEDEWDWLRIGDVVFRVSRPCTRCIITTIDPSTGDKDAEGEPLKTLRKYRQLKDPVLRKFENNAPMLGVYLGVLKIGRIHIGDTISVGKWKRKNLRQFI